MRFRLASAVLVPLSLWLAGCGDSPSEPRQEHPVPPPGPHYTVLPIPLEKLARITPLGFNNKPLPADHTYWDTCDLWWLLPGTRPCVLEHVPIRAPGSGVIVRLIAQDDGSIADPLGRMSCDEAGTAAGAWFLEGTPVKASMNGDNAPRQLDPLLVIDPAAPSWDQLSPASGIVALKAWRLDADGTPRTDAAGSILIEVLANEAVGGVAASRMPALVPFRPR